MRPRQIPDAFASSLPTVEKGFTLVELMMVMVVASIVMLAVNGFYSIGLKTQQRAEQRTETASAWRFTQKLLEDKFQHRSRDGISAYMKQGGIGSLEHLTDEIMISSLQEEHPALYRQLNYEEYDTHAANGIVNGTSGIWLDRYGSVISSGLRGAYLHQQTFSAGILYKEPAGIEYSRIPLSIWLHASLENGEMVSVASSWNTATREIQTSEFIDLAEFLQPAGAGSYQLNLEFIRSRSSVGEVCSVFAGFGPGLPPVSSISGTPLPTSAARSFRHGASLFCDDGMLFYELADTREIVHALYLQAYTDGRTDEAGRKLHELVYARTVIGETDFLADGVIGNILDIHFSYFDAAGLPIAMSSTEWTWTDSRKIVSVEGLIRVLIGDRVETARVVVQPWGI